MELTRRDFVKFGGSAAIAVIGMSATSFGSVVNTALQGQTANSFRDLIGTEFHISGTGISSTAKLIRVQDFPYKSKSGECFSLLFDVPVEITEQATYKVFHPRLGNFDLLMTNSPNKSGSALLATINRT